MADEERIGPTDREHHRYRVIDSETQGLYVIVSSTPKTRKEIDQIIAAVIKDEGRVSARKVRTILI
jgi:hypothetical protein